MKLARTHRRLRRTSLRRLSLVGAGAAAVLTATVALPNAHGAGPAPAPDPLTATAAGQLAADISARLGPAAAGAYYDAANQRLVVNVLTETAAAQVRAAGADYRIVEHTLAALTRARAVLKEKASIPGTAWAMDPRTNQIRVRADRTVRGERLARLTSVAASLGGRVAVTRTMGEFKPLIAGGDAIWGRTQGRCSLGFNVTKGGEPHFLTAGHCTRPISTWTEKRYGTEVAQSEESSFPGDDFGLARYTAEVPHPSEVNLHDGTRQEITKAGEATVGQLVKRSGSTTKLHSGFVTALDATVNYQEGEVEGLIQTDVCAEPGDSGGSLFDGETALGLTSGGNGDCARGGVTFFQPVQEALERTGTQIG